MSSLTAINFTDQMRSSMAAGASHRHCGRLRFHKMIQSDCPDGQITKFLSSPICKNISPSSLTQISSLSRAVPSHRGALRNVINAERDAVDAVSMLDESC